MWHRWLIGGSRYRPCGMDTTTEIVDSIETLEALYFLLKSFEAHQTRLTAIRASYPYLSHEDQLKTLEELTAEISDIRRQSGALSDNEVYRALLSEARQMKGVAYLSKLYVDSRLFSRYDKVFTRWPHLKLHAAVVFDWQSREDLMNILEVERMLFEDVQLLLARSRDAHKNVDNFRRRLPDDQTQLQSYLRAAATGVFRFLESYLNGLAYDCFMTHHDQLSIKDHDLLGEWDSTNNKIRYVNFKTKVFSYPAVVAKTEDLHLIYQNVNSRKIWLVMARMLETRLRIQLIILIRRKAFRKNFYS